MISDLCIVLDLQKQLGNGLLGHQPENVPLTDCVSEANHPCNAIK